LSLKGSRYPQLLPLGNVEFCTFPCLSVSHSADDIHYCFPHLFYLIFKSIIFCISSSLCYLNVSTQNKLFLIGQIFMRFITVNRVQLCEPIGLFMRWIFLHSFVSLNYLSEPDIINYTSSSVMAVERRKVMTDWHITVATIQEQVCGILHSNNSY